MAGEKTQLLQKNAIRELTRGAQRAKQDLECYLEDLEMYSKPEFWKAITEAETGAVNHYKSIRDYARKLAKK